MYKKYHLFRKKMQNLYVFKNVFMNQKMHQNISQLKVLIQPFVNKNYLSISKYRKKLVFVQSMIVLKNCLWQWIVRLISTQPFRKTKNLIFRNSVDIFFRHITSFTYDRESIIERLPTRSVLVCLGILKRNLRFYNYFLC